MSAYSDYPDLPDIPDSSSFPLDIDQASTFLRKKTEFSLYSAWEEAQTDSRITYFLCMNLYQEEEEGEENPVTLEELERELALHREYSQQTVTRIDPRLEYFNRMMLDKFVVDVVEPRYQDYAINHLMNLGKHAPQTYTCDQLLTEPLNDSIAPGSVGALYALPIQDSFDWAVLDSAFVRAPHSSSGRCKLISLRIDVKITCKPDITDQTRIYCERSLNRDK
jgi:hypothetical protein